MLDLLSLTTQTIGLDSTSTIVFFVKFGVLKHILELPNSLSMRSLNAQRWLLASAMSSCSVFSVIGGPREACAVGGHDVGCTRGIVAEPQLVRTVSGERDLLSEPGDPMRIDI